MLKKIQSKIADLENRIAAPKGEWFKKLSPKEQQEYLRLHKPKLGEFSPTLSHEEMKNLPIKFHQKLRTTHYKHNHNIDQVGGGTAEDVKISDLHGKAGEMHHHYLKARELQQNNGSKEEINQRLQRAKELHNELSSFK